MQGDLGKGRCRSCRRTITWAFTEGGKVAPFEKDPKGAFVLDVTVMRKFVAPPVQTDLFGGGKPATPADAQRYSSHFSSCPESEAFRRPERR